ncbi:MAG: non-ribosomal peptide synthetase [bacterium]|nr:non-ribosomal peptide synthetase [bacterium]
MSIHSSAPRDVISAFRAIARRYPDHAAVVTDGRVSVTYAELDTAIMHIAAGLQAKGIGSGKLVAITIEKSWQYIAAVLGTWAAGAAFMPLPAGLPEERKKFQLTDAAPDIVLNNIDDLLEGAQKSESISVVPQSENLAYIIYTSGSTGQPKGVMVSHTGLHRVFADQIKLFRLGPKSRSLFLLSTAFDASLSDIGTALLSGAALCIETGDRLSTAARMREILEGRGITYVDLPPSLLGLLDAERLPRSLKTITIGGEAVSEEVVRKFAAQVRLVNVYGPTEATICSSAVVCTPSWKGPDIGKPIAGMEYRVVDEQGQDVPAGTIGELWIAGPGLALGYLHNDALNRERFVLQGRKRYYRTGDLVRRKGAKTFFVGRRDRQVKVSGQLVAPEEIEMRIMAYAGVSDSAVFAMSNPVDTRTALTACVEAATSIQEEDLHSHLKKYLPAWMVPHHIIFFDHFPRGASGKKDLGALQKLVQDLPHTENQPQAMDYIEAQLAEIWSDVLGKSVGLDQKFFALGGDSLAVLQVVTTAERRGLSVPIGLMVGAVTVRSMAGLLRSKTASTKSDGRSATDFATAFALTPAEEKMARAATSLPVRENGRILITGATGFLGSRLLHELLRTTDRSFVVLIRAASAEDGLAKLKRACIRYEILLQPNDFERIEILTGDISAPHLGLAEDAWRKTAFDVSEIYHAAAIVNMVLPYAELKAANVDGVKEIAALAMTGARKKINYASTLSVFVATDRNAGIAREEDDLSKTQIIYGGYAQSKWVAERFLQQFSPEELPVNVFRFGLITGDAKTGRASDHDYLEMFVRGLVALGSVPEGNHESLQLDATPIDFAARAMSNIGQHSQSGCYHVANRGGFSLAMIIDALRDRGFEIKTVPAESWAKKFGSKALGVESSAAFAALCRLLPNHESFERLRGMDLFQATGIIFDANHTDAALRDTEITIPAPDRSLLDRYLDRIFAATHSRSRQR